MPEQLPGHRLALVTGAAGGTGREVSSRLASDVGCEVRFQDPYSFLAGGAAVSRWPARATDDIQPFGEGGDCHGVAV